jgi:hypothetical protein
LQDRVDEAIVTDLETQILVKGEIGFTRDELTQGEAASIEREGGLLLLDEDDAVLDLQLFGFDMDPAARRISGTVRLVGAGEYIRTKLNQPHPEEILTETRDGFNAQHGFFRILRDAIRPHLEPLVSKLREGAPKSAVNLSEKTRERHRQVFDLLNRLAGEMLGTSARVPVIPTNKRIPPSDGIQFINSHVTVKVGIVTPVALLINTKLVTASDMISISCDRPEISVSPSIVTLDHDGDEAGLVIKMLRIKADQPDLTATVSARWRSVDAAMSVATTTRDILTPVNGIEFERDEYNVRFSPQRVSRRNLRLFVDIDKVPLGSEITLDVDDPSLKLVGSRVFVTPDCLVVPRIGQLDISVAALKKKRGQIRVTASYEECSAETKVTIVKREKPERSKEGLFKDYKFEPLERKVQTLWNDGFILINTKDPVNARYFGDDPGKALEEKTHCQLLLADLILNECLQVMVSQAIAAGRLDTRFPNNPEIDLRTYVDEKKFDIGADIHSQFVPRI